MSKGPVGVVGLGLMGAAITERLLEHGYPVQIWNRTAGKARPLVERGAIWSDHPAATCDRVIISLYSSDVVAEVLHSMAADLRPGQVLVDTTTGMPEQTISMGIRLLERGVRYLDAPISGSSEQTRRGEAVVMVGGEQAAFDDCGDLWPVLGKKAFHTGPCGSAAKMKLVTNLVLGLNRAVLAEGLAFAGMIGVTESSALEVLRESPAYSRAIDVKGRKMIERDYSVQARLAQHLKDVNLMLESARSVGRALPLSQAHRELLEQAVATGLGELDNSAIVEVLRESKPT
ncbi:MAG TPA: NAD(P)-dependent oxidoreductase [Caulifigura sp.]|jgi:3-hydroxyisobutyrate dehydrogenase-like beta-hydroxyacid dehydrogenase|nr:NAD(P)-dependent oxidoreductase [Caulifigura sp.]